jgi:hypothetical protein
MKSAKETIKFDVHFVDDNKVEYDFSGIGELEWHKEIYGDDADGNRGVLRTYIDQVDIETLDMEVWLNNHQYKIPINPDTIPAQWYNEIYEKIENNFKEGE